MWSGVTYITVSSQAENCTEKDSKEPNSDFACTFRDLTFGTQELDVALYSISLNIGPTSTAPNATDLLPVFVLSNIITAQTRVGGQKMPVLQQVMCSQSRERETFDFGSNLQWHRASQSTLSRIGIQLATDSFARSAGGGVTLHSCHTPIADAPTVCVLALRPAIPKPADQV